MIRTQVQLPDELYRQAKQVANRREISLAELVRRGLEYMIAVSPIPDAGEGEWQLPEARSLGSTDPFTDSEWRANLHLANEYLVAEDGEPYAKDGE